MRYDGPTLTRSHAAAITGEIAERLLELGEVQGEARTQKWLLRLATLFGSECPRAGWVYLRIQTGDLGELTASHSEHGEQMARSKQAEHKETDEALRVITRHYPELGKAINELRHICPAQP